MIRLGVEASSAALPSELRVTSELISVDNAGEIPQSTPPDACVDSQTTIMSQRTHTNNYGIILCQPFKTHWSCTANC